MSEERTSSDLAEAFRRSMDALAAPGVSYALIGGLAVACYGLPRPTRDIDILISVPRVRLPALLERFAERGFSFELESTLRRLAQDHLTEITFRGVRVDMLDAVLPLFRRAIAGARETEIEGKRVRVASAEHLVALKLLAARDDDVRDVRGILAAQQGSIDTEEVRRELEGCGAAGGVSLLERLAREVAGEEPPRSG